MRYVVLGGKGFIGKGVVSFFKKKKIKLINFNKISKNIKKKFNSNDIIINCLGKQRDDNSTEQLKKLIYFLRINKKNILWIQLSTPLIYNQNLNGVKITEKTKETPFNIYAQSKMDFDNFLKKKKNINFNYLIMRISTVYDKNMKSKIFYKLKIINKMCLSRILINKDIILNYISLNELVLNIYRLSKKKISWNKVFLISQNIKVLDLLSTINPKLKNRKNSILNIFFFSFKYFLAPFFNEQLLFLTNKKIMQSCLIDSYIKIENKEVSNKSIKFFLKL